MIDRAQLAEVIFNAQSAFQRRHGIRDGYIDDWQSLAADDLARSEYVEIADAVLALVGPEVERLHDSNLKWFNEAKKAHAEAANLVAEHDRLREFRTAVSVVLGLSGPDDGYLELDQIKWLLEKNELLRTEPQPE